MTSLMVLVLLGTSLHGAVGVTHSLKYFYTASSGISNFPAYVSVGLVDDVQISQCDSNTNRNVPKQEWMKSVLAEDPQYWDTQTQTCMGQQQNFKANIGIAKQRFNQTGGVHIFQYMYGCEWDDQAGRITGYRQYGYDGDDFLAWNTETNTFIAPVQQAELTKNKWNNDRAELEYRKNYLNQECPEWLKKYVGYGRSSLMRTELPSVSFLQKTPSSPVTCHATGFYPNKAEIFWRKNGHEIHEGVDKGEVLPNSDGSFQMSVDMDLPSTEDWTKYECVFQLAGAEDSAHPLEKTKIKTNYSDSKLWIIAIIAAVVVTGVVGFIIYKKKGCSCSSNESQASEDSIEAQKKMLQQNQQN